MRPRDITRRVLGRPLRSPYGQGAGPRWLRWAVLAGSVWLLYAAVFSDHSLWRILRLRQQLAASDSEVSRVQEETRALEAQLNDPHERAEHAEEVLRRQGLARPNEILYRLGGPAADSTAR